METLSVGVILKVTLPFDQFENSCKQHCMMLPFMITKYIGKSFTCASLSSRSSLLATILAVFTHAFSIHLKNKSPEPPFTIWLLHYVPSLLLLYYQVAALYELSVKPCFQKPRTPFDDVTSAHSRLILYHRALLVCIYGVFANMRDVMPLAATLFGSQAKEMLGGTRKDKIHWVEFVFIGASAVFMFTVLTTIALIRVQRDWNEVVTEVIVDLRRGIPVKDKIPVNNFGVSRLRPEDKRVLSGRWGR